MSDAHAPSSARSGFYAGIDSGSWNTKAVVIDAGARVLGTAVVRSGADLEAAAKSAFSTIGLADLSAKRPAGADTIYSICSISKLFTSIAVMQQRDAGKLRLDASGEDPPAVVRHPGDVARERPRNDRGPAHTRLRPAA